MAGIRLEGVSKVYPGGHAAVEHLDLEIRDGELLVLVGPSGCGKSTTLRLVAGLEDPTAGRIWIGERDVTHLPPQERDMAMVFQSYALYPHKTVRENLAFPLKMHGVADATAGPRILEVARLLELEPLLDRTPRQLSGGQRQRVALGRAMVRHPQAFLMDEPLSNLDARLRVETRAELSRMHRSLGATTLYVTHDQEEAMTLGDRIAVMREGVLQQVATPVDMYRRPATRFVAGFIGSPAMNFLHATTKRDSGQTALAGSGFTISLADDLPVAPDSEVVLGVRPPDIDLVDGRGDLQGEVEVVELLGSELLVHVRAEGSGDGATVRVRVGAEVRVAAGDGVALAFRRDRLHVFDDADGRRLN